MTIRAMLPEDLPRVAELSGELGYPAAPSELSPRYAELRSRGDGLFVALAETGIVSGWIHVALDPALTHQETSEIKALVVGSGQRGRGFGRELVRSAEAWSARHACRIVRVRSRTWREDAKRFYQSCGYEVSKTQNVFSREL